jgi:hypothetical protein
MHTSLSLSIFRACHKRLEVDLADGGELAQASNRALPSSSSLRPSGLIITMVSAVSSTSTPHGIESMIC